MDTNGTNNKFAFALLGLFLILFIFSLLPDSFFKSKKSYSKDEAAEEALVLLNKKLSKDYLNAPSDVSKEDSVPNWKKALLDSADPNTMNATRTKEQIELQKDLDDPKNLTAQIAKNSYTISAYLKQQNIKLDDKSLKTISKNLIAESISDTKNDLKVYTKNDFKITSKNDAVTLKNYGNQLSTNLYNAYSARKKANDKNELNTLVQYFETNDEEVLKKYNTQILAFKKLRDQLLTMTVPSSMINIHTKETNLIENYINTLIIFSKTNKDPLKSTIEIDNFKTNLENFYSNIKEYNQTFIEQNIYFTNKDPGYMFFNDKIMNIDFKIK